MEARLRCRMHEASFPKVDEVTMIKVMKIDMEATNVLVELLEYNNLEAMIQMKELSRRRIRSMRKIIQVGNIEPMIVISVDPNKKYVDLSKKQTTAEEKKIALETYNKIRTTHAIMGKIARKDPKKISLEQLYQQFGWPLARKYKTLYQGFKILKNDPEQVMSETPDLQLDDELTQLVIKHIKEQFAQQPIKARAEIEVTCHSSAGVDGVRLAIKAGEGPPSNISIKLLRSPLWVMMYESLDEDESVNTLQEAINRIKTEITHHGGQLTIKVEPFALIEEPIEDEDESNEDETEDEDETNEDENKDKATADKD